MLTEVEKRALSEEYNRRHGSLSDNERDTKRLREFIQTFTPEGALATEFERQAENRLLYSDLELASVEKPVVALRRAGLEAEPMRAPKAPNPTAGPTQQAKPINHPSAPSEKTIDSDDDLIEFEDF